MTLAWRHQGQRCAACGELEQVRAVHLGAPCDCDRAPCRCLAEGFALCYACGVPVQIWPPDVVDAADEAPRALEVFA